MNIQNLKWDIKDILGMPVRNRYDLMGRKIQANRVTLEWWDGDTNVGDGLAPVIYEWMLEKRGHNPNSKTKTAHLMTVGSLIGAADFDATVWGAGIMNAKNIAGLIRRAAYVNLDIRAVRGPITRELLLKTGYQCPEVYGDPAILMPYIYNPSVEKKYKVSLILHHLSRSKEMEEFHMIDVASFDYKKFIDEIVASEMVISSSLHGIIVAETYGVPALFLNNGVWDQSIKYLDWYYSTGRYNVKMISSVEEIEHVMPMKLPELDFMRRQIQECFPYDLWV